MLEFIIIKKAPLAWSKDPQHVKLSNGYSYSALKYKTDRTFPGLTRCSV